MLKKFVKVNVMQLWFYFFDETACQRLHDGLLLVLCGEWIFLIWKYTNQNKFHM